MTDAEAKKLNEYMNQHETKEEIKKEEVKKEDEKRKKLEKHNMEY